MAQQIIDIDAAKPLRESIQSLQMPPRPLMLFLGEFDAALTGQVRSVWSRVLVPVAVNSGVLIVDDGSSAGATLIGQVAADEDQMPPMLAIVPHDRPDIDPNHALVLRLPSTGSDAIKSTFQIADLLIEHGPDRRPALVVLAGGGPAETKAVIRAAQRGWPIVVLTGTGGLADAIADAKTPPAERTTPPSDPDLRQIVETATTYLSPVGGSMDDLTRIILGRVETRSESSEATLAEAWQRFDNIDIAARVKQTQFRNTEMSLIVLAVMAALFAILTTAHLRPALPAALASLVPAGALHILVILIPISISIIAAYNSHFRDGNKWILLRGAAEALKREIFRFRAKAGVYSDVQCQQSSRESKLAAKLRDITSALEQSEVNKTSLAQQPAGDLKRATFLTPDEYIEQRVRNQEDYFIGKTRSLSKQLTRTQLSIYIAGGAGTFLAAVKQDIWVALATAVVSALSTKLQADQVETSLVQYNQALVSLKNIRTWWKALSAWEKNRPSNIDVLVDQTEKTLESETAGWVQQMQSALDKLTEKEPPEKPGTAPSG